MAQMSTTPALAIDTERVMNHHPTHFAVIDIGSNSIRLVVYDDLSRAPFPRFNEKSLVALGAGLDADGNLTPDAITRAVRSVRRLEDIAAAMEVERIDVLATEATRKAPNGHELVAAIREQAGLETRVLTGDEEATHGAEGILAGFFQPHGLVGDIGGGSLEVAEVLGDTVGDRVVSMPLGALPVKAIMTGEGNGDGSLAAAKAHIDGILATDLPPMLTQPVFYAIGGGWRALARVHMAMTNHPIGVVHGYELDAREARKLAKRIARMTPDEVAALPDVPSRRVDTLPAAALVMSRVLRNLRPEKVVFSALGLREGWLYAQVDETERRRDPLLEGAMAVGLPNARVHGFSEALAAWTDDLFPGERPAGRRVRLAACALTDLAWRDHAKIRATETFHRLLRFPFVGISHPERAFLALALMARYGGRIDDEVAPVVDGLLSASQIRRAQILGRALLLAHRFSASVPGILAESRLVIDPDAVRLHILNPQRVPDSDAVQTRLRQLAKATGVDGTEIVEAG